MKRKRRFARKPESPPCEQWGEDDGVDPRTAFRKSSGRVHNRKALQLCGQVARTLCLVLSAECGDEVLRNLGVASVVPAPDSTRLLVTVYALTGPAPEPAVVLERLRRAHGLLRSQVAAAINRRKAPELTFRFADLPV